jgi:carbamoyl-phosphate synthase large subunit
MSTILVTGAGGAAAISVIRALLEKGCHVVAVDSDPLAAGMFLAHDHATVSPAIEGESFVTDLADASKRFHVDVVVCTDGEEMLVLNGREFNLVR